MVSSIVYNELADGTLPRGTGGEIFPIPNDGKNPSFWRTIFPSFVRGFVITSSFPHIPQTNVIKGLFPIYPKQM